MDYSAKIITANEDYALCSLVCAQRPSVQCQIQLSRTVLGNGSIPTNKVFVSLEDTATGNIAEKILDINVAKYPQGANFLMTELLREQTLVTSTFTQLAALV